MNLSIRIVCGMIFFALIGCSSQPVYVSSAQSMDRAIRDSGLKHRWERGRGSLWLENPGGLSKTEMEKIGHVLCKIERGYIITWWQDIDRPSGRITKISCL